MYGIPGNSGGGGGGFGGALGAMGGFLGGPWGMGIAALLPGLLGTLAGGDNPRKLRQQALSFFDPRNIDNEANQLFRTNLNSAGYNMARSELIGAGQAGQGALQRQLAQTGLNRSGVGASLSTAAGMAPGFQMGRLNASAWENAMRMAQQSAMSKAQTLMGMPMQRSMGLPLFAGGINALLPLIFQMMQQRQRGGTGGGGGGNSGTYGPYGPAAADWDTR